ncbi:hypothetical protein ACFX1T_009231 [Malus domestica]
MFCAKAMNAVFEHFSVRGALRHERFLQRIEIRTKASSSRLIEAKRAKRASSSSCPKNFPEVATSLRPVGVT